MVDSDNTRSPAPIEDRAEMQVDGVAMVRLLGPQDRLLTTMERQFPLVQMLVRGNEISLSGDPGQVQAARRLVEELIQMVRNGSDLEQADVTSSARILESGAGSPADLLSQAILTSRGKSIRPKTLGQKSYVDAIDLNTIVFGIGPAGTGKTYLAMAKAVQALQRKEVNRIILTRPAVEAGERLGFLPGTLTDKIDPYLRPLYDALNEMMDPELVPKLLAAGTVEVAPLAYMRGRTLNDSFVVLDEAQNTTPEQMKMFLTRLGFGIEDGGHRRHHPGRPAAWFQRPAVGDAGAEEHRRHPLRRTDQRGCRSPFARRPHRRRVHQIRCREAGAEVRTQAGARRSRRGCQPGGTPRDRAARPPITIAAPRAQMGTLSR